MIETIENTPITKMMGAFFCFGGIVVEQYHMRLFVSVKKTHCSPASDEFRLYIKNIITRKKEKNKPFLKIFLRYF
jgi:hypothetical protein